MNPTIRYLKLSDINNSTPLIFLAKGAEIVIDASSDLDRDPKWIVQAKNGLIVHHYRDRDIRWLELNRFIKRKRRNYKMRWETHWVASNDLVRAIRTWPGQETTCIVRDGYKNLRLDFQPQ